MANTYEQRPLSYLPYGLRNQGLDEYNHCGLAAKRLKKELLRLEERGKSRNKVNSKKKKRNKKDKTGYKKKANASIKETLMGGLGYDDFEEYTKAMERWDD